MSFIKINNLSFGYGDRMLFENFNLNFDSTWKLGLISRNGRGKTTLLKMLNGQIANYSGQIISPLKFCYCPLEIKNENLNIYDIIEESCTEPWMVIKEAELLGLDAGDFDRAYSTFSGGEKVKLQLAIAFASDYFVLLDEPSNHLDMKTKEKIKNYLSKKSGFILVSHDRYLIDEVCDHIISINKSSIDIIKGNYSTWNENFSKRIVEEQKNNDRLTRQITNLEKARQKTKSWAIDAEKEKFTGTDNASGLRPDRGALGKKAAKIMKRSKSLEKRIDADIDAKKNLLKDIENSDELKLFPINLQGKILIEVKNLTKSFDKRKIFENLNFKLASCDRLAIVGDNGSGKTTLINILLEKDMNFNGSIYKKHNLKVSYLPQNSHLSGSLEHYAIENDLDLSLLCMLIRKLDFKDIDIKSPLENLSEGEKRKVLLAGSLLTRAEVYIWDEPFNYIDINAREQIEKLILTYKPTLIFIEHDKKFIDKIATDVLNLS